MTGSFAAVEMNFFRMDICKNPALTKLHVAPIFSIILTARSSRLLFLMIESFPLEFAISASLTVG
ncbi:uncharacterized protein PHALS_01173 [Plasmopara halstedii]|uniref:Uncharacterized protein n=1 Tax=Plasmopara halstedii TaxID=4781 RepID=A0A0P1AUM1_PLAHL|nr:uncharacterized protein PHALS_01173 [Plasmopara halstedii]CEG44841.1 hypothetical protein PHALS_01173 [Plasmopara halstedii]|eukprot:XP_024581210.1 hypothetical protein PHALS_01173 [Plasmopara halstedii]